MSTIKVEEIQHPSNSNNAVSIASDSSVSLKHSGSAKLATTSTGVSITGTCTADTLSGSLASSNLTGALPAIDGSALTGLSASDATKMPLAGGTFTGSVTFEGAINENVVGLFNPWALDADDGTIQTFNITGNRTVTMSLTTGQSVLLLCDFIYGGSWTVTWPSGIKWVGGSAPTLSTTAGNPTAIEFFQVGSQLYGAKVGDLS
tara:strand:+ start:1014 stop:1625 length:612 start_codon:yes stop_codon:yes gene_type:complete